jgi:Flp pilus assembly protein TadG
MKIGWGSREQQGASLVEFAILAPFLILLVFGIIEFAWVFAQNLDVRHGAREGARLASVNFPVFVNNGGPRTAANTDALAAEACAAMDLATGATIDFTSAGGVGDPAVVVVTSSADTITGLLDWALSPAMSLSSTVEIRLEQPALWENGVRTC